MITFEEVKEIFKKSIDTTDTMNQAIENSIRSIYLKGYNDAQKSSDTCTDLCKSCETKGCIFQSGIKREKCNFYTSEKKHRKEDE